ncbi:hypothetical protein GOBAR_AA04124 [Gossypium barbadense]|uniref:Uncharacterized protein n=1 Tax=Gossypium barbadense TaxID=3634 RepID=A0A2P5YLM3_GOSBA|nr:hypothetical protein GOBAR_AA04124 [Gossypium barbadense]
MLSNSQFSSNDGDGDPHPESDRNTKKVRFKDNLVEEDTIMDRDPNPKLTLLWKDKLLGGLTVDSALDCSAPTEGSNNDLRLLEGDVNTAIIDGVPAITFSNRIKDILFKEIELMVIVKLLRRNIGYNALHNRILFLWKPVAEDYNRVSSQGPWIVYGQYLTVQLWTKHFSPSQYYPGIVMAWIRFLNLPGYLYKRKIIGVIIGGAVQRVKYEALSTVCFTCVPLDKSSIGVDGSNRGKSDRDSTIFRSREKDPEYGPWMLVEKRYSQRGKRDFSVKVLAKGSFDKAGYGANEGLGSPSGSIMKEGLGSESLERMSRMPKYALDKSLVGSKHACTQNDSHFDIAEAQVTFKKYISPNKQFKSDSQSMERLDLVSGSILNDPKDKRSGGSQSNRKTSFALQGRGNRFKPSRNTRIPQILCRNSNAMLNGVGSHLEGNNGLES